MTNLLIHGINGTMGQYVYDLLADNVEYNIIGFDSNTTFKSNIEVYDNLTSIEEIDVIIDFSHHSLISNLLDYSNDNNIPLVLCTTGLTEESLDKISKYKSNIPIFKSGNMSLGINVLIELAKIGAKVLNEFDIEIIEKHHNKKIDAPSGTAFMIADAIKEERQELEYSYGRSGIDAKREANEIGIHAVRGGTITGEHTAIFAGIDEVIEIKHQATSKNVFAKGAIEAAKFIINKESGLYDMTDLIKGDN